MQLQLDRQRYEDVLFGECGGFSEILTGLALCALFGGLLLGGVWLLPPSHPGYRLVGVLFVLAGVAQALGVGTTHFLARAVLAFGIALGAALMLVVNIAASLTSLCHVEGTNLAPMPCLTRWPICLALLLCETALTWRLLLWRDVARRQDQLNGNGRS